VSDTSCGPAIAALVSAVDGHDVRSVGCSGPESIKEHQVKSRAESPQCVGTKAVTGGAESPPATCSRPAASDPSAGHRDWSRVGSAVPCGTDAVSVLRASRCGPLGHVTHAELALLTPRTIHYRFALGRMPRSILVEVLVAVICA